MKCTKCNIESNSLVFIKNKEDVVTRSLCYQCLLQEYMTRDIYILDQHIKEAELILNKRLVEVMNHDQNPKLYASPILKSLIGEQKKFYELLKKHIEHVKLYRLDVLSEMEPIQKMQYELKIAVGEERFEDAQLIYNQIKKIA
jgi:hypothetical protein